MAADFSNEIMGQSRHQFIYGYNTQERHDILKGITDSYPVKVDIDLPMGIYLENYALPDIPNAHDVDRILLSRMSREYLSFLIAYTLLNNALENNDFDLIIERVSSFLKTINRLFIDNDGVEIKSLKELLKILKLGCEFYSIHYKATLETGAFTGSFVELPISFLSLDSFIRYFKKLLNNNSYVALIVDVTEPISKIATQTINDYLSKRCNSDLSMKVACEPGIWKTYYDFSGNLVEYTHDYGVVELDDSSSRYLETQKAKWDIDRRKI
ncbi:MAG: hypothetical protein IJO63_03490 [Bacilli bacterium]|nr:hypothetical protein [Bacilli bacterium]